MDEIELRRLILQGEDTTLEFKSKAKLQDVADLAAEYVAFLNKRGGTLLLGVEDDGTINGFTSEEIEGCNQKLRSMAKDQIEPSVILDSTNIATSSGVVISLTIEEGIDKPYQTRKGSAFYIRSGDEKRHVSHRDELRRLFQIGSHVYAEQQEVKSADLRELNSKLFCNYFEARFQEDAPESDGELHEHLRRANLAKGDNLTIAGTLLFAKHPQILIPGLAVTKAIWFEGTDIAAESYKAERNIEGTLPEMYDLAKRFLESWNLHEQPPEQSFNANGVQRVNPRVFEEILTNAFIHRDYFVPDKVKIFIFDDRIEIISPGTLPNSLTLEEALEGNSRSRNPIIEKTGEFLMNYKGAGSGLRRAKKLHPSLFFKNSYEKNAFIATIPTAH